MEHKERSHNRFPFSAITKRPNYDWPGGKRLAVYVKYSLEQFYFGEGLGAQTVMGLPQPDVHNHTWRDYGNRVGGWRLIEMFDELKIPVAVATNTLCYDHCPELVEAFRNRGDEILCHGLTNSERVNGLSEAEEKKYIEDVTATMTKHEKRPPVGWIGSWLSETPISVDLLSEAGYQYTLDWVMDDQPVFMATRSGKEFLAIPNTPDANDLPLLMGRGYTPEQYAQVVIDIFDELRRQSKNQPLVFTIPMHGYVIGQPSKLKYFRRILEHVNKAVEEGDVYWTLPRDIATHVMSLPKEVVPRVGKYEEKNAFPYHVVRFHNEIKRRILLIRRHLRPSHLL
eukprot:TRINITY_DN630_c0_g1_i2.p1 TRINITY_DN630_c0_g1~~TRINITY_DN630_c0_g1_i2.p1  ORF type:complete len:340 (+),score=57.11 TRINITY_DN630_c0_g1_i2:29-1048(+)